jgi:hypothetical protein
MHAVFRIQHGKAHFALTIVGFALIQRLLAVPMGSFIMLHGVSVERFSAAGDSRLHYTQWFQTHLIKLRGDLGSSFWVITTGDPRELIPSATSTVTYGRQLINVHDPPLRLESFTAAALCDYELPQGLYKAKERQRTDTFAAEVVLDTWTIVDVKVPENFRSVTPGPTSTFAAKAPQGASSDAMKWRDMNVKLQALKSEPWHVTKQMVTLYCTRTPGCFTHESDGNGVFIRVAFWHGTISSALIGKRVTLSGLTWNNYTTRGSFPCLVPYPLGWRNESHRQLAFNAVDAWTCMRMVGGDGGAATALSQTRPPAAAGGGASGGGTAKPAERDIGY